MNTATDTAITAKAKRERDSKVRVRVSAAINQMVRALRDTDLLIVDAEYPNIDIHVNYLGRTVRDGNGNPLPEPGPETIILDISRTDALGNPDHREIFREQRQRAQIVVQV